MSAINKPPVLNETFEELMQEQNRLLEGISAAIEEQFDADYANMVNSLADRVSALEIALAELAALIPESE